MPQGLMNTLHVILECTGPENYQSWARRVQSALRLLDFDWRKHLSQTYIPVVGEPNPDGTAGTDGKLPAFTAEEVKRWTARDNVLFTAIELRLSDEPRDYLQDAKSAGEAWRILETTYAPKGLVNDIHTLGTLHSTKADETTDMETHIRTLDSLKNQLKELKSAIPDIAFAALLLNSLPASYDTMVQTINPGVTTQMNSTYIRQRIMTEY